MKIFSLIVLCVFSTAAGVMAQGYETQYPYDPYSPAPRPQRGYGSGDYGGNYRTQSTNSMLTYGFLSGHYTYNDLKDSDLEGGSGFGVDLSLELMKPLFLHLGLDRLTSETPSAQEIEVTSVTGAAGLFLPLASRFHIFGEVGVRYDFVNGDYDLVYTDDFSVFVRPGIRVAVTDRFELGASLLFNNTDNYNEFVVEVDAFFALFSWLDLHAGVDFSEDINSYQIGGRWRW
jgi:hypothetical protein